MVLNTGTEETGVTVSVLTMTIVGDETMPPADDAMPEDTTGDEATIEEGIIGCAGGVPFGV